MPSMNVCPDAQALESAMLGLSSESESETVEQHLTECVKCQTRTRQLAVSDDFVDLLIRQQSAKLDAALSPLAEELIKRLKTLPGDDIATRIETAANTGAVVATPDAVPVEFLSQFEPAESADEIGRLGEFRVLKLLGKGGMGAVFLAEDIRLSRQVALKIMHPAFALKPHAAARFLLEARAAAAIKNDHVVSIYRVGEERGVAFLAQELLTGETLEECLRRNLPELAESLRIGREIALGLAAAHERHLLHRDIKPANIWLEDRRRRVKILDFGLARSRENDAELTESGMILGTPAYMAPEQAMGERLDERCDLFSLGCVLYRMTTGTLPFTGKDALTTLRSLAVDVPARPCTVNSEVPVVVSDFIEMLLSKDRTHRPESAESVAETLLNLSQSISAPLGSSSLLPRDPNGSSAGLLDSLSPGNGRTRTRRIMGISALGAIILAAIVITITSRDGVKTKFTVPDGTHAKLDVKPGTVVEMSQQPGPVQDVIPELVPGQPLTANALVTNPAHLPGVDSWTLETVGHRGGISDAKFSPKGTSVATADSFGSIRVWEPTRGKLVKIMISPEGFPSLLAWSPDERQLASVESYSGKMRIWDVEQGRIAQQCDGLKKDWALGVSWSADGKHLITNFDKETTVWDTQQWKSVDRDEGLGWGVTLSPDDRKLAGILPQGTLQFFDFKTLHAEASALPIAKDGRRWMRRRLAWSPKGDLIAALDVSERTLWVLDASNGRVVWTKPDLPLPQNLAPALGWSADGRRIAIVAATDDAGIIVFDGTTGNTQATWKLPQGWFENGDLRGLEWSPADNVICVFGHSPEAVGFLDPKTGAVRRMIEGNLVRSVMSLAWFGDESTLVADIPGGGNIVRAWKIPTLEIRPSKSDVVGVRVPGGRFGIWNREFRAQEAPEIPYTVQGHLDGLPSIVGDTSISWSEDGQTLGYSVGQTRKVYLFEYPTGKLRKSFKHPSEYGGPIALSPDAMMIVASEGKGLWLYRTEDGALIKNVASKNASDPIEAMAFSRDGQLIAVGTTSGLVQIWKSDLSAVIKEFRAHVARVRSLLWSHDSRQLVTGSFNCLGRDEYPFDDLARDPTIRFWNPHTGESLGTILVHRYDDHLAVSPNGHYRIAPIEFERHLVYVAQTANGQVTLTPSEFAQRFGWKNDPDQVRDDRGHGQEHRHQDQRQSRRRLQ